MKLIVKGAEASIYSSNSKIIKIRHQKKYRISELDEKLRRTRNNREIKILKKLEGSGIPVPKVLGSDSENNEIQLEFIEGKKLKDVLDGQNCTDLGTRIGRNIARLHSKRIIHGDLTTSNMILKEGEIFLIDFGLSFFSVKAEDRAVDLHLLNQALKSSHSSCSEECFSAILRSYGRTCENYSEILNRLEKVESRGRYKGKK